MAPSCLKQDLVISESQKRELFKEHRCSWSAGLVADSMLSDPFGQAILPGRKHFNTNSNFFDLKMKLIEILFTVIYLSPDEIYDTYVVINSNF